MLEAERVTAGYAGSGRVLHGVSFRLEAGEIVGLSGPSGCGKSTLGRVLAGLMRPRAGVVRLDGAPLPGRGPMSVRHLSQTPSLAMNPRWRIRRILAEAGRPDPALRAALGVLPDWDARFPHELSEGQIQRVSLLRALGPGVRFLVADEISAALDAVAQAEIWRSLKTLAHSRGIGILMISHDRALIGAVADRDAPPMGLSTDSHRRELGRSRAWWEAKQSLAARDRSP